MLNRVLVSQKYIYPQASILMVFNIDLKSSILQIDFYIPYINLHTVNLIELTSLNNQASLLLHNVICEKQFRLSHFIFQFNNIIFILAISVTNFRFEF